MSSRKIIQITMAFIISIFAGFAVRQSHNLQDSCTREALDDVLDGGHLILEDECVLVVSPAAVFTGDVTIESGMLHSSGLDQILIIEEGAKLSLYNTSVLSGSMEIDPAHGGGIYNAGDLSLHHVRVVANSAEQGGGIYNAQTGRLFIHHSEIARNRAREGGGIYNRGLLVVADSIIQENSARSDAGYGGYGAGIVNKGVANIVATQIINNRGDGEGIGIDTSLSLFMRYSVIMGNQCLGEDCQGTGVLRYGGTADVRRNYWGSEDGPGEDGSGSGDGVIGIDPADYEPFLTGVPRRVQEH